MPTVWAPGEGCPDFFMVTEGYAMQFEQWKGFNDGVWKTGIDVRDFIDKNYTPYTGDSSFLSGPTERTKHALARLEELKKAEQEKGGVLAVDTTTVSSLCNYKPGYLDGENDLIVGLQTDEPLKRGVNPFGGIRMARSACEAYGYQLSDKIEEYFTYRTTHNSLLTLDKTLFVIKNIFKTNFGKYI